MKLIIDKNGKAVDLEDVSVTLIYESKEEADQMKEAMADGRVRFLEWHPIELRDGKVIGERPDDGQVVFVSVIFARGERGVTTDVFCRDREADYGYFEDWDWPQVKAWAPMPEPYEERED